MRLDYTRLFREWLFVLSNINQWNLVKTPVYEAKTDRMDFADQYVVASSP